MTPQRLTLFVSGPDARGGVLCHRLTRACEELGPAHVQLEIVDVRNDPERARAEGVLLAPTLQAGQARDGRRVFGDLLDVREAMWLLGVRA